MQRVRIEVVRSRRYGPTDGYQVYTDRGTGVVDWDHPATARRVLLWEDVPAVAGHLLGGHARGPHLCGVEPDGHCEGTWLLDEHLRPAVAVRWESEVHVFGRFKYVVAMEDAAGNAAIEEAVVHETIINSEPVPAMGLRGESYDQATGRLALRFTPSWKLVG